MRINALPTRSRTARGRVKDRRCRGGCGQIETLNHVIQHCHRTHDMRIKRHNAVADYIIKSLREKEFSVEEEPHFKLSTRTLKPDIIATLGETSIMIDAQVMMIKLIWTRRMRRRRTSTNKSSKLSRLDIRRKQSYQWQSP